MLLAFTISAVTGGIVNCDSKGSLSLTNCLSLSRLQPFVDRRDRFALSASCEVQIEMIGYVFRCSDYVFFGNLEK